jgi:hypothetical protein
MNQLEIMMNDVNHLEKEKANRMTRR